MTGHAQAYLLRASALVLAVACGHAKPIPTFVGTDGPDTLEGTDASEILSGGEGGDQLAGKAGDDELRGGPGDDHLFGGGGDDLLSGGAGDDIIEPGAGEDRMLGGPGADMFVLRLESLGHNPGQILDFNVAEGDRIAIKGVHSAEVEQLMNRLSLLDGVLVLRPDVPGRSATALVRIGSKYRIEMLTKKKSIIFSFDF